MRSSFQTIVIIIFGIAFAVAIAVFSGIFSSSSKKASTTPEGNVIVWGILPSSAMQQYVTEFNITDLGYTLTYVEHKPETFNNDLVNALANGTPPDVLIFSSEIMGEFKDKLYTIPYAAYSERLYRDTNVDGATVFLTKAGPIAMPILVDPLVVYYNKDILASASFVVPPTTWNDMTQTINLFTKRDVRNNITKTAIALGEYDNINHARDILSALFLQTGNPIVTTDTVSGALRAALTDATPGTLNSPTSGVLSFYTSFSNMTSSYYSWNRALPSSRDMFLAGRSAFYIGRASELFTIQSQNPNLNFDVMQLFQTDNATRPITFGSFIAVGIVKNSLNFPAAYAAAGTISGKESTDNLSKLFSLPPAQRDLLLVQQNNPYVSVFFKAALASFTWPDPNRLHTEDIFRDMIGNVTSGRTDADAAIYEANNDIQSLIR